MIRPMIRPMIRAMIEGFVEPVPGFIFKYKMDGNDSAFTPQNPPIEVVVGLDLPDQKSTLFNGTNQYMSSSDTGKTGRIGTGPFSIVVRFRMSSLTQNIALIATGNASDEAKFRLRISSSGKVQWRQNGDNHSSSATLVINQYYHLVINVSGNGGTSEMYLDNVLDSSDTNRIYNYQGDGSLQVGAQGGSQDFSGNIDDVRMYTKELDFNERQALLDNVNPALVTNGDFSNGTTDWAVRGGATLSVTSGVMEVTDTLGNATSSASQDIDLVAGKVYIFSCEGRSVIGSNAQLLVEWSGGGDAQASGTSLTVFTELGYEFTPQHTTGDSGFTYRVELRESGSDIGDICEFKNVSVMEKFS